MEEWADEDEDDECIPWPEDWEEMTPGPDTPELDSGLNDKGGQDGTDETEQGMDLLLAIRAQRDAACANLKRVQEARKKTEEEQHRVQRQAEEQRKREETEENFGEWMRRKFADFLTAEAAGRSRNLRSPPAAPLPPTRSPVTFAELLPDFAKIKRDVDEMARVVEALLSPPETSYASKTLANEDETRRTREEKSDAPAGAQSSSQRVGTDVRRFWRGPDQRKGPADVLVQREPRCRFRGLTS